MKGFGFWGHSLGRFLVNQIMSKIKSKGTNHNGQFGGQLELLSDCGLFDLFYLGFMSFIGLITV